MRTHTLLLLLVIVLIAVFAALNWSVFMAQTTLSLGVAVVQAPLGLVMLGLLIFLTALFLVFVVYMQTSFLLEARRNAKELQANRELAEQAEASRFTELREFLENEIKKRSELDAQLQETVMARLDRLESGLQGVVEQSGNTLSAYLEELEDRLEREGMAPRSKGP